MLDFENSFQNKTIDFDGGINSDADNNFVHFDCINSLRISKYL